MTDSQSDPTDLTTAGGFAESRTFRAFMDCLIQWYYFCHCVVVVCKADGFISDLKVEIEG